MTVNLDYLKKNPRRLNWKIIAGPEDLYLDYYQTYDLIYDEYDLRIRKFNSKENLRTLRGEKV